jgi:hypothetical protein
MNTTEKNEKRNINPEVNLVRAIFALLCITRRD